MHSVLLDVLSPDYGDDMKRVINDRFQKEQRKRGYIAHSMEIVLEEWNHDIDHVHVMFRAQPKTEQPLSMYIKCQQQAAEKRSIGNPGKTLERSVLESEFLSFDGRRAPVK